MKTEVVMTRPFLGSEVRQKSKLGFFSATDLIKIANIKRRELQKPPFNFQQYLNKKSTKEFVEELQKTNDKVIITSKGRNGCTWVHPFLFIDIALACNPKFKVEVYSWLYDELLKNCNDSGDSYKTMCGYLYENQTNKSEFPLFITKVANYIKEKCDVEDWNKATEKQLKLRDKMHENITTLTGALKNNKEAVRLGVQHTLKTQK